MSNGRVKITYLNKQVEELSKFKKYFDELYGQGLEIANWHENGELESFDSFYENAVEYMNEGEE